MVSGIETRPALKNIKELWCPYMIIARSQSARRKQDGQYKMDNTYNKELRCALKK
jgi:hypothetical protein